jgi:hypothetical protein
MLGRRGFLGCALCAGAVPAAAQTRLMPFAPEELRSKGARLARNVPGLFAEDLRDQLAPPWPARLRDVRLAMPMGEEGELPPWHFDAQPATRTVRAPLRTLVFLDEMSGLFAYLERRRCGHDAALRYMGLLVARPPERGRPPGPLEAFGLTERIHDDAFVKDVSEKLLGSTVFFMLAHELGHLALGHRPGLTGLASQRQEAEADGFALEACASVRLFPGGLSMFFLLVASIEGPQATHPLSGSRLNAIAAALRAQPRSFVDRAETDVARATRVVAGLANELDTIGRTVDDPAIRAAFFRRAAETRWDKLRFACPA